MTEHHGSCLCGDITWKFSGTPDSAYHCHCKMCRKAHGAAFGSYYFVPAERFSWTGSNKSMVGFRSSPTIQRSFCGNCGSMVPDRDDAKENYFIPAGSHDNGPAIVEHIFVGHKADWHDICDELPKYQDYAEGTDGVVYPDKDPGIKSEGVIRGSCLCDAVAFEVIEPFKAIHNCHCSRCRKARAAAFTTNGFTSSDGVRFLRGEEHIRFYKVPDARFFTHAFCDICGSGMPRIDLERKIAVIPLGALDDDVNAKPLDHIFVDDKADWYQIGDDLPQYSEMPG